MPRLVLVLAAALSGCLAVPLAGAARVAMPAPAAAGELQVGASAFSVRTVGGAPAGEFADVTMYGAGAQARLGLTEALSVDAEVFAWPAVPGMALTPTFALGLRGELARSASLGVAVLPRLAWWLPTIPDVQLAALGWWRAGPVTVALSPFARWVVTPRSIWGAGAALSGAVRVGPVELGAGLALERDSWWIPPDREEGVPAHRASVWSLQPSFDVAMGWF